MKRNSFEESEVPYQTLAKFGLTHEMIEDLPMHAMPWMTSAMVVHRHCCL